MALGFTTNFIHIIKSIFHQRQDDNLDFIKLKNVCLEKDILTVDRKAEYGGKTISNIRKSDEGFIFQTHKDLLNLNNMKMKNPIKTANNLSI